MCQLAFIAAGWLTLCFILNYISQCDVWFPRCCVQYYSELDGWLGAVYYSVLDGWLGAVYYSVLDGWLGAGRGGGEPHPGDGEHQAVAVPV